MDDRESLYFDTISLAGSDSGRKSLSQSRNTIYHSAVDLVNDDSKILRSTGSLRSEYYNSKKFPWHTNQRHSSILEQYIGSDEDINNATNRHFTSIRHADLNREDLVTASETNALQNGRNEKSFDKNQQLNLYELSEQNSNNLSGDENTPVTYSQWKFKTHRKFEDGNREVDYVLVFNSNDITLDHIKKRETFESNLKREGLHLEYSKNQRMHFVKIHAPLEVLRRYAEILKMKLRMQKIPGQKQDHNEGFKITRTVTTFIKKLFDAMLLNNEKFTTFPEGICYEFSKNYQELYPDNPFDAGQRIMIIHFILLRQHFIEGNETSDNLGIEKLLNDGVYNMAYPLHNNADRDILLSEWATLKKWKNFQPLDHIKMYFGSKIALYYAWLEFYIYMLIPISIIGVFCLIYSFITSSSDPISQKICSDNKTTLMCPQCDRNCDFWYIEETCIASKINFLIDNNVTVVFALIMSIWAVIYLELWKRYSFKLIHRWGLTGFSQHIEHPRTEYLAKINNSKDIKFTESDHTYQDPYVPYWGVKFWPNFTSYGILFLFICISLIAIFSMIIYRMAQSASESVLGTDNSMTYKIMFLPITAGIIDLIVISLLDFAYSYLAVYLTNMEYCRTQTEYNDSLTIKNYLFQFVNYYSSLFYIAFLKGKFVGYPKKYNRILGFRQEECAPGGCLMELCVQLMIIMIGKQAVNGICEMLIPYVKRMMNRRKTRLDAKLDQEDNIVKCNQWTEDFHLLPWKNDSMFSEYLEMVLQFGFVTLFGLAFPLGPFFALINNLFEIRLDAIKMLRLSRRPIPERASNIGVWYNIMKAIVKISVFTSAVIVAFSTNLIPKIVYKSTSEDMENYLNFTLAVFKVQDFEHQPTLKTETFSNITSCRYTEFRNPPWDVNPYKRPLVYWKIFTFRLAFIVVFQNFVGIIQSIIAWIIPDVSSTLLRRINREDFLVREFIIEHERTKTQLRKSNRKFAEKTYSEDSTIDL